MPEEVTKSSQGESTINSRQKIVVAVAIAAILASAVSIYYFEFRTPNANVPLHQSVGHALAEETSRVLGHHGNIVIISMDARNSPELKIQVATFSKELKTMGDIAIKDSLILDPGENPKFRPGSGLSAKRFLKIVRKHPGVDAFVSFVGAPQLSDEEVAQLKSSPKLIAETHSPEKLMNLLQKRILVCAIVPRFEFPAPGPRQPHTDRQWFDHYFQVVAADTQLPNADDSP